MFERSINVIDLREWPTEPFQALLTSAMAKKRASLFRPRKLCDELIFRFSSSPLHARLSPGYRMVTATPCLSDSINNINRINSSVADHMTYFAAQDMFWAIKLMKKTASNGNILT